MTRLVLEIGSYPETLYSTSQEVLIVTKTGNSCNNNPHTPWCCWSLRRQHLSTRQPATAVSTTHKRFTSAKKSAAPVNPYSKNKKKILEWCYRSSNETRFYCCCPPDPQDTKTRLFIQALQALSSHLVYACVKLQTRPALSTTNDPSPYSKTKTLWQWENIR